MKDCPKTIKNNVIDSFDTTKDEYNLRINRLQDTIQIKAIKNSFIWFTGELTELSEEELEYTFKEFKNLQFDIITKNNQLKILVKGACILLNSDQEASLEQKEIFSLKMELNDLKKEISSLKANQNNNIVWVTVHSDNQRRGFSKGDKVITITVDKKLPQSILLIQGIICVHGESNAESGQYWTYGKTVVFGQTDGYSNNLGYGRAVSTKTIIENHKDTGPQLLTLTWHPDMLPFTIINPNKTDHPQFSENQTQSTYSIWEILK